MATKLQVVANKENARHSTGAKTSEGKAVVAKNAIKHGVFTNDLIISGGDGKEDAEDYYSLLGGLFDSLSPNGQMEQLLVEKIAVDFWRLRRVLRFETSNIRKYLDMAIYNYSNPDNSFDKKPANDELEEKIEKRTYNIRWNLFYIDALGKGEVSFNAPTWENDNVKANITDDFYRVLEPLRYSVLTNEERKLYDRGELEFEQLKAIVSRAGYTDKDIVAVLVQQLEEYNKGCEKEIEDLEKQMQKNKFAEQNYIGLHSLPVMEETEKILRYERSLQKSIMRNIIMLKQLQSSGQR